MAGEHQANSVAIIELQKELAVVNNKIAHLSDWCHAKEAKIAALQAFQNRLIGYASLAATLAGFVFKQYF